jgi:hypothetical protein
MREESDGSRLYPVYNDMYGPTHPCRELWDEFMMHASASI